MSTRIAEGFSVTHAQILNGTQDANDAANANFGDIYGVSNASLAPDTGNFDNTGDDQVLSTWYWFNFATLTVEAGYLSFETLSTMTGDSYTSSGSAPNDWFSAPLWTESSMSVSPKPVLIRTLSRDSDGQSRSLDFVLYKVQFSPMTLNGPQYKQGLRVNFSGRALMTTKDEKGTTLTGKSVGRVVSRPFTSQ